MKKFPNTAGINKRGFTGGTSTTTYREDRSTARGASKHKSPTNNPTLIQKLKELAAEAEDDEDIISDLPPQEDSDNSN